jgi:hypothetical protein
MPHAGGIAPGHETIAIVLDLVQPAGWSVLVGIVLATRTRARACTRPRLELGSVCVRSWASSSSDRGLVDPHVIASGTPDAVSRDPIVQDAYLGAVDTETT